MEIFIKAMQGTYAYVLIFQILVVSLLFLFLLWLLVRRIQEPREDSIGTSAEASSSLTQNTPDSQLRLRVQELEKDNARFQTLREENEAMNEKVKYLESKLLEYEILQEEIGTLSTLKIENEQLKRQMMEQSSKPTGPTATPATPIANASTLTQTTPVGVTAEHNAEPVTMGMDSESMSKNSPETPTEPSLGNLLEPQPMESRSEETNHEPAPAPEPEIIAVMTPPPAEAKVEPHPENNLAGLDQLLEQIDQLTKSTDKQV